MNACAGVEMDGSGLHPPGNPKVGTVSLECSGPGPVSLLRSLHVSMKMDDAPPRRVSTLVALHLPDIVACVNNQDLLLYFTHP